VSKWSAQHPAIFSQESESELELNVRITFENGLDFVPVSRFASDQKKMCGTMSFYNGGRMID
jgi:hypothetical protein